MIWVFCVKISTVSEKSHTRCLWNYKIYRCILYFPWNIQKNALFSWRIYTVGNNFTRPLVATVVTNFKSGNVVWPNTPRNFLIFWFYLHQKEIFLCPSILTYSCKSENWVCGTDGNLQWTKMYSHSYHLYHGSSMRQSITLC